MEQKIERNKSTIPIIIVTLVIGIVSFKPLWKGRTTKIYPRPPLVQPVDHQVAMVITSTEEQFAFGGPIGIDWVITNRSPDTLECDFTYPNPYGFHFTGVPASKDLKKSQGEDLLASRKSGLQPTSRLFSPLILTPGMSYKARIYLNRYLIFPKTGKFIIEYSIELSLRSLDKNHKGIPNTGRIAVANGEINISLKSFDEKIVDEKLKKISNGLSSKNKQKKLESIEALRFLDIPLVIKYLQPALLDEDTNVAAITALGKFNSPKAMTLMESALLTKDPDVFRIALSVITRKGVLISVDKVKAAVDSKYPWDDQSKHEIEMYLEKMGNKDYIPVLIRLTKDQNTKIAEEAQRVINILSNKG